MDDVADLSAALAPRYVIERPVGEGGMATVFLARDLRHSRRVAIKILKRELGALIGTERFLAEIAVTASLQHPHLLPLFDSGEAAGRLYYVMPYVDGETLRQRLQRERQLPISEAIRLTLGVASALDYAHKQGVIHRDLKPENILLHEGEPLVSDFGIALAVSNAAGERITQSGMSVGTPQYMSPEQAAGDRHIDSRSDVYSLGAVLFEMLSGETPHSGPSPQSVVARIATEEPRLVSSLRRSVPPQIDVALDRALSKLPADRFASAAAFADALSLREGAVHPTRAGAWHRTSQSLTSPIRLIFAASVIASAGIGAFLAYHLVRARSGSVHSTVLKLQLLPPQDRTFERIIISPDGRRIAFTASDTAGRTQLWIRPIDSSAARAMPQTDGASDPFWSPDSKNVGFFADGKLKRVGVGGGTPQTICDLPAERGGARGGTWSRQGTILFAEWEFHPSPIYRVSETGGRAEPVSTLEDSSQFSFHWWPAFLPDGKHFLYLAINTVDGEKSGIYIGSLESRDARLLQRSPSSAIYATVPDGRLTDAGFLLYIEEGTLKARALDARTLALTGEPIPIADGVSADLSARESLISTSETGVLVYAGGGGLTQLRWLDRKGNELSTVGSPGTHIDLRIAPDDRRLMVQREDETGKADLWLLDGTRSSRFTFDAEYHAAPTWSPDGSRVTFFAGKPWALKEQSSDGSGGEVVVRKSTLDLVPHDWSPDGRHVLYSEIRGRPLNADVWALEKASGDTVPIARTDHDENFARFSPDGHWILYQSNQSGVNEIYLRAFPPKDAGAGGTLVSVGGGTQPRWPRRGGEVFYVAPDNRLMSVTVRLGATVNVGVPQPLFRLHPAGVIWYDVTSDAQRFAVATPVTAAISAPATVVVGWFDAILARRQSSK